MEPVTSADQQAVRAVTIAEYREWPERLDWEERPTPCATPTSTATPNPDDDQDEDEDPEPLDLHERDAVV